VIDCFRGASTAQSLLLSPVAVFKYSQDKEMQRPQVHTWGRMNANWQSIQSGKPTVDDNTKHKIRRDSPCRIYKYKHFTDESCHRPLVDAERSGRRGCRHVLQLFFVDIEKRAAYSETESGGEYRPLGFDGGLFRIICCTYWNMAKAV